MSKDTEDTAASPIPAGAASTTNSGPIASPSPAQSSGARGPESATADRDRAASEGERERPRSSRPKVSSSATGPHSEPQKMLDLAELPETYGVDEVEILCKDPWWYFVYWEVTEKSLDAAKRELHGGSGYEASSDDAKLVLRLFVTPPSAPTSGRGRESGREIRDVPLSSRHGRRYLEAAKPNSLLRAAVGLLTTEGLFLPIAHSSLLRVPPQQPSSETSIEWLHVLPGRGDGQQRERIQRGDRGSQHKERALPWRASSEAPGGAIDPHGTLIVDGPSGPSSSSTPRPGSGSGGID